MRKFSLFVILALLLTLVAAALVSSSGCQKSSSTTTTEQPSTSTPDNSQKSGGQKSTASDKATVTITKDGFDPQEVTVKAGGTVTWGNKSGADAAVHVPDLGEPNDIADGATYKQTFDSAGTYSYHNHLNQNMNGTVTVE